MRPAVDDESFATDWGLVATITGAEAALATTGVTTTGVVAKVLPGIGAKKARAAVPAAGSAAGAEAARVGAVETDAAADGCGTVAMVTCGIAWPPPPGGGVTGVPEASEPLPPLPVHATKPATVWFAFGLPT